jgi:hypothetical protein
VPDTDNDPESSAPSAEPVAAPAPSFVPADEFKQFQTTITSTLDALREGISAIRASGGTVAPSAPAAPRITEEEFDQAMAAGDGKTARAYIAQQRDDLKREHIDPLSSTGLDAVANLTKQITFGAMPRYAKYAKEIDALVAQMPSAARLNGEALRLAYDAVVGRHADEIEAEARDMAARRTTEPPEAAPAGRRGVRVPTGDRAPTVEEFAGQEGVQALAELGRSGRSADDFARALGYKDWKSYIKDTEVAV